MANPWQEENCLLPHVACVFVYVLVPPDGQSVLLPGAGHQLAIGRRGVIGAGGPDHGQEEQERSQHSSAILYSV